MVERISNEELAKLVKAFETGGYTEGPLYLAIKELEEMKFVPEHHETEDHPKVDLLGMATELIDLRQELAAMTAERDKYKRAFNLLMTERGCEKGECAADCAVCVIKQVEVADNG